MLSVAPRNISSILKLFLIEVLKFHLFLVEWKEEYILSAVLSMCVVSEFSVWGALIILRGYLYPVWGSTYST